MTTTPKPTPSPTEATEAAQVAAQAAEAAQAGTEAFLGRVVTDFAGASSALMTVLGDRLGLYGAMAGAGPVSAADLAKSTGLDPRLVTEWLASQTVSEYVVHDPTAGTFELPETHAAVLARADSPAYLVGAGDVLAGHFLALDDIEQAFRDGGGLDYGAQHPCVFSGIERYFRTAYLHQIESAWFPAVPGLVERLERGARVADVGSGHGVADLLIGRKWPASTVTGFDAHEPSVAQARAKAIEAGSPGNVSFRVADAAGIGPGPYDVVVFFDSLHDLGDPPAALRRAHEVLADGGILVAVEPWSTDRLEDGIGHPTVRIGYASSTALCTPGSLAQPGQYGLGTQGGPARRIQLLAEAGFREAGLAADTGFNLVLAAVK
ncbi:methyltransferase domain-containing protein [Streptomyces lincolnensis]|uniref:class I SAM-dependent methyltransferase n=1 Tax=Streptomyces lincolnensis TaxID=1915 RepID=UPI001E44E451|nr:class I SAM-dependent methyltransferase [Streptomyces lincolnensis]MCD7436906.1 methyltransferase domain-containing protein [Streptomyces lincolnensis]